MLSIIIPAHNLADMTRECIDAIKENTGNYEYEIILVDNGSDEAMHSLGADKVIRLEKNFGFPKAVNIGLKIAEGETLCITNNDVVVTPHWDDKLLYYLGDYDIVGPCTNEVLGRQKQHVPIYGNKKELYGSADQFYRQNLAKKAIEVNWLIGFCWIMKREVYAKVGDFDEIFGTGNSEDIDYCYRAKKAGFKMAIAPHVFVHHYGGMTHDLLGISNKEYGKLLMENSQKLREKYTKEEMNEFSIQCKG